MAVINSFLAFCKFNNFSYAGGAQSTIRTDITRLDSQGEHLAIEWNNASQVFCPRMSGHSVRVRGDWTVPLP
jgi:hypothetical protein